MSKEKFKNRAENAATRRDIAIMLLCQVAPEEERVQIIEALWAELNRMRATVGFSL